jgi:hypothetical protein
MNMADFAGSNSVATLNGLFKEVYASDKKKLVPDGKVLMNKLRFVERQRQPGNAYHQPVVLGLEHGVTFADPDEGAFELNAPVAG